MAAATPKQIAYIRSLAATFYTPAEINRLLAEPMTKEEASESIDSLLAAGARPARKSTTTSSRRQRASRDHEDCLSVGPCGPNCAYAHVFGR